MARSVAATGARVAVFKPAVSGLGARAGSPTTRSFAARPGPLNRTTRSLPIASGRPSRHTSAAELAGEPIDPDAPRRRGSGRRRGRRLSRLRGGRRPARPSHAGLPGARLRPRAGTADRDRRRPRPRNHQPHAPHGRGDARRRTRGEARRAHALARRPRRSRAIEPERDRAARRDSDRGARATRSPRDRFLAEFAAAWRLKSSFKTRARYTVISPFMRSPLLVIGRGSARARRSPFEPWFSGLRGFGPRTGGHRHRSATPGRARHRERPSAGRLEGAARARRARPAPRRDVRGWAKRGGPADAGPIAPSAAPPPGPACCASVGCSTSRREGPTRGSSPARRLRPGPGQALRP